MGLRDGNHTPRIGNLISWAERISIAMGGHDNGGNASVVIREGYPGAIEVESWVKINPHGLKTDRAWSIKRWADGHIDVEGAMTDAAYAALRIVQSGVWQELPFDEALVAVERAGQDSKISG